MPCSPARAEPLESRTLFTTAALLADLNTAAVTADLTPGVVVNGVLYAGRVGPKHGELWRTAGTRRIDVLHSTMAPAGITAFGSQVVYPTCAARPTPTCATRASSWSSIRCTVVAGSSTRCRQACPDARHDPWIRSPGNRPIPA